MELKLLTGLLVAQTVIAAVVSDDLTNEVQNRGSQNTVEGKLKLITISQERIEAEFYTTGGGIQFRSETHDQSHFLSITTAEGDPLMVAKQPQDSAMLMSVMDTDFPIVQR